MKIQNLLEGDPAFIFPDDKSQNKYLYKLTLQLQDILIEELNCTTTVTKRPSLEYKIALLNTNNTLKHTDTINRPLVYISFVNAFVNNKFTNDINILQLVLYGGVTSNLNVSYRVRLIFNNTVKGELYTADGSKILFNNIEAGLQSFVNQVKIRYS